MIYTGTAAAAPPLLGQGASEVVRKAGTSRRSSASSRRWARWPLVASVELPYDDASAVRARRFVSQTLDAWEHGPHSDALLVVSELVTNAVIHARSRATVTLRAREGALRIEVADFGGGSPEPRTPAPETAGGRGLLLVAALAQTWGIDPIKGGKVVWAELAT